MEENRKENIKNTPNVQAGDDMQTSHKRRVRYKGKYPKKFEEKYKELQPEKYQDTVQHVIRKGNTPAGMHISIMVKEILDSAKLEFSGVSGGMPLVSNSIVYQRDCCKRAFVRGAFLSAGSISDPQKGYHFEIVCPSREISGQLQEIIHSFHIGIHTLRRNRSFREITGT